MNSETAEVLNNKIQIYLSDESGLINISVKKGSVDRILFKDGFIKIHNVCDNVWHCYNMKYVKHIHYPEGIKLS